MLSLRLAYEPRAIRVRIARACVACPYRMTLVLNPKFRFLKVSYYIEYRNIYLIKTL
jgi:hypothetical protein